MPISSELIALAQYMAGEFDNREQAIAEPAWYVHLRLWQRPVPVPLFPESIALYAEQANIVQLDRPYRPRIMQLCQSPESSDHLQVRYYMLNDMGAALRGAGANPGLLTPLTLDQMTLLPGCTLRVHIEKPHPSVYRFSASLPADAKCCFSYQGETRQVSLGFEATPTEFFSYDKGIDPATGKAIWGAMMGPFRFIKRQDFAEQLLV